MAVVIVILILAALYLYLIYPSMPSKEQRDKFSMRSYAHRGFYDNDSDAPENSLPAFEAAMQNRYGCELDVQYTKDKQLVVFHDNDFKRSSGIDKKVWELTYDEIKRDIRLFGTNETVPLFSEVLATVNGREPLIVEIKAEQLHKEWYYELCADTLKMLRDYHGDFCVESFHPCVVAWFRKNAPDLVRGQLVNGRKSSPNLNGMLAFCLENLLSDFLTRPHFIAYKEQDRNFALRLVQKLGAMTVMWTVRTPERHEELRKTEDALIFEHYSPEPFYTADGKSL